MIQPAKRKKSLAVVGAGPAGLAFSCTAAQRGHEVTLFDAADRIGGQFNMAKRIPGKEEFYETLKYYARQLELNGVNLRLGSAVSAPDLGGFDEVVLATKFGYQVDEAAKEVSGYDGNADWRATQADRFSIPAVTIVVYETLTVETQPSGDVMAQFVQRFGEAPTVVRSSAPGEDAAGASFAGLHESFTDIADEAALLDAVRLVFDDGHDTGLYSWKVLYDLATNQVELWENYLARLRAAKARREPLIDMARCSASGSRARSCRPDTSHRGRRRRTSGTRDTPA